jgi:hypothetical protein
MITLSIETLAPNALSWLAGLRDGVSCVTRYDQNPALILFGEDI